MGYVKCFVKNFKKIFIFMPLKKILHFLLKTIDNLASMVYTIISFILRL